MKQFNFSVPVTGTEYFSIRAETLEEAIELLHEDSFKFKDGDDIEWNMGWDRDITKFLEDHLDEEFDI